MSSLLYFSIYAWQGESIPATQGTYEKGKRNVRFPFTLGTWVLQNFQSAKYYLVNEMLRYYKKCTGRYIRKTKTQYIYMPTKIFFDTLILQVLHSRNDIMHSGTMRLDDRSFLTHKDNCVMLLSDSGQLKNEIRCSQAIAYIDKVW